MSLSVADKLNQLRQHMQQQAIDYYVIPSKDEHNNEYVPDCWQRRQWLSDFTGSAGDMVVGMEMAYLWTDSRYFLQAEQQLDAKKIKLMKMLPGALSLSDWLAQLPKGTSVGVDPKLISIKQAAHWQTLLQSQDCQLIGIDANLIDQIWQNRPSVPLAQVHNQPELFAGKSTPEKLAQIRQRFNHIDGYVLTNLDEIAWVLNVRGADIAYNPVVISYLLITPTQAIWFVDSQKVEVISSAVTASGVSLAEYDAFADTLTQFAGNMLIDPATTSWWVQRCLQTSTLIFIASPIASMKAIKNPSEIKGMQSAHIHDGVAMVKFFHWLDEHWQEGLTEVTAAQQLDQFRQQQASCRGLSFATISAFAENSAIVHYQPHEATAKLIGNDNLYLLDSGGQYVNGTTDVTRTLHLGEPTLQQKQHYTLVLKGHLALRHAVFPARTCGYQLDALARQFLWQQGLDYGHGTGHGVGCYLCVHEGPQGISPGLNNTILEPGMMVSNEPGVYLSNEYGIRIENVCQVVPATVPHFNTFADLTLVPYAKNLIEFSLLTAKEIAWLNDYHHRVYQKLASYLTEGEREWLALATVSI